MTLEDYIERIDGFLSLKPSEQIPYLGYFLIVHQGLSSFGAKDIDSCFIQLHLPSYSNISAFLSKEKHAKRALKNKSGGYTLSKIISDEIEANIGEVKVKNPSTDLFPLELLDNTRVYLIKTAKQAILCYDYQLYDACLVMIRRLLETLIIELFERHNIKDQIQDANGNYLFCADLIDKLLSEKKKWTIGRNSVKVLPEIKLKGDLSAHNRRFNATKSDIDAIKSGLRIIVEELIHLIDYEQWNKERKVVNN
jgi:hypothetical protein